MCGYKTPDSRRFAAAIARERADGDFVTIEIYVPRLATSKDVQEIFKGITEEYTEDVRMLGGVVKIRNGK